MRVPWDDIGEINDIVLSPTGDVQGVLVDIGGFLGIGARTVALDMGQLHFLRDETDELRGGHELTRSARGRPGVSAGDGPDRRCRDPRGRRHPVPGPGYDRGAYPPRPSSARASRRPTMIS